MSSIMFSPMTRSEYSEYMRDNISRYAQEGVRSGRWKEEDSIAQSKRSIKEAAPKGLKTKDSYFFNLVNAVFKEKVGVTWLAIQGKSESRSVFIYDILIFEQYRNTGLGAEAMKSIEAWAKKFGARSVWLHAFWHNQRAIAFYKRLGYSEVGVTMHKNIAHSSSR